MISKKNVGLATLFAYTLLFFSCEHLQITPKNYRGGNCDPDTIYYVNDIAPILITNCGISGCHDAITGRGGVVINSYENIIKTAGINIGNGIKSELIKTMRKSGSNSMPPSGKLPDSEIAKVRKWIDQGAKNNKCIAGCDSTSYTYSKDILPIINKNCVGCHNNSSNTVLLNSYPEIKGKVDDGRLWGSINHLFGYKSMPSDSLKLSECDINKIGNWISIGAPEN